MYANSEESRVSRGLRGAALLLILSPLAAPALADPTTPQPTRGAVARWLETDGAPLGARPGRRIRQVRTFRGNKGRPGYYVISLAPSGFVIAPADDRVEPIICFSQSGTYVASSDNPLGALVDRDLRGRMARVRGGRAKRADRAKARPNQREGPSQMGLAAATERAA